MSRAIDAVGDRVLLGIRFDAEELAREVHALDLRDFVEYSVIPLTAPTAKPAVGEIDYADGSWADWHPTDWLDACPTIASIVDHFGRRTTVTLVRLLRLAAGGIVAEHTDPTLGLEQPRSVIRLTVPIITNDDVEMHLNDSLVPMRPGDCWYLRFSDPHRVTNRGLQERIHLSIDMVPNAWVRSLVADAVDDVRSDNPAPTAF